MGLNWAEHTVEIDAPIETCFDAIVDYESFPAWQGAVDDTQVLERDRDGLGKVVRLFIDAKVRKVDYTLDYRYDRPERIEWDFVEGNGINGADGHYLFEELGDGRTRATYKLGLEVGIPMPGMVARRVHKQTLKASVEDLKREAERRAAGAEPGSKHSGIGRLGAAGRASERPLTTERARGSDVSVREAAGEAVSAGANLARVMASRALGAATEVVDGIGRRLGG
jgi:uncharacterized membrane protein